MYFLVSVNTFTEVYLFASLTTFAIKFYLGFWFQFIFWIIAMALFVINGFVISIANEKWLIDAILLNSDMDSM